MTQNDFRYRLDRLEERQKENAETSRQITQSVQQNTIRLAELSVLQAGLAKQMEDMKKK